MRLKLVLIALTLFSAQASAKWEAIDANDKFITWLDRSSIQKQDNNRLAWIMIDYYLPRTHTNGKKFQSIKFYIVYKCNEMQTGMKSFVMYTDGLGKGDVVANANGQMYEVDFTDVVPDTGGEAAIKEVCGN